MYEERMILCVSNSYEKKYYFNEDFSSLPESVQDELKALSVLQTEDVGGIFIIGFMEDGELFFESEANKEDLLFDDIGSDLKIKELKRSRKDLWEALETYFKVFFLDEPIDE